MHQQVGLINTAGASTASPETSCCCEPIKVSRYSSLEGDRPLGRTYRTTTHRSGALSTPHRPWRRPLGRSYRVTTHRRGALSTPHRPWRRPLGRSYRATTHRRGALSTLHGPRRRPLGRSYTVTTHRSGALSTPHGPRRRAERGAGHTRNQREGTRQCPGRRSARPGAPAATATWSTAAQGRGGARLTAGP